MACFFPPQEVACAWNSLTQAREWVLLSASAWQAVAEVVGDMHDSLRLFAILPANVVASAVAAAQLVSVAATDTAAATMRNLSPVEAAQVGLMWRIARRCAFTAGGGLWASFVDIDPLAPNQPAMAAAPPALALLPPVPTTTRKVSCKLVMDQGDESELPPSEEAQIETWRANYVSVALGEPVPEVEPTSDQLTCLHHRVSVLGRPPYVDFGVWTPFNRKVSKGSKFRTWIPTGSGDYMAREIPGPANYQQWLAAWRVFAVACRMLLVVDEAALNAYQTTIEKLVGLYPDAWHLIAMADDRARSDQIGRVRRAQLAAIARGCVPEPDWRANAPWSTSLRLLACDAPFWDEQVRHPAGAWLARGGRGAQLAPDEAFAAQALPGGVAQLSAASAYMPSTPGPSVGDDWGSQGEQVWNSKRRKKQQAKADAAAFAAHAVSLGNVNNWVAPSVKGKKGKGKGKGKAGASDPATQYCFSFDKRFGACAKLGFGSTCPSGRLHLCPKCGKGGHRSSGCSKP